MKNNMLQISRQPDNIVPKVFENSNNRNNDQDLKSLHLIYPQYVNENEVLRLAKDNGLLKLMDMNFSIITKYNILKCKGINKRTIGIVEKLVECKDFIRENDPMEERISIWAANGNLANILNELPKKKYNEEIFSNMVGYEGMVDLVYELKKQGSISIRTECPVVCNDEIKGSVDVNFIIGENNSFNVFSKHGICEALQKGEYNAEVKCVKNYDFSGGNGLQLEKISRIGSPFILYIFCNTHIDKKIQNRIFELGGLIVKSESSTRDVEMIVEQLFCMGRQLFAKK